MNWTQNKPTKEGYYWVKRTLRGKAEIHYFENFEHFGLQPTRGRYSTQGWEYFSGPIEKPKHDKKAKRPKRIQKCR